MDNDTRPECPASTTYSEGVHCVHWWESYKQPCCTCGDNQQEETPCRGRVEAVARHDVRDVARKVKESVPKGDS